jgi:hypothetical protein
MCDGVPQMTAQHSNIRYSKYGSHDGFHIPSCLGSPPPDVSLNSTGILFSPVSMAECVSI